MFILNHANAAQFTSTVAAIAAPRTVGEPHRRHGDLPHSTDNPRGTPDYRLLYRPDPSCVHIEFEGLFEQRPVRWRATIVTLARKPGIDASGLRQFIDIDPHGITAEGTLAVRVGLAVDQIDGATIQKTIIMIRQYKRLRRGRMEFGPPQPPHPRRASD